MFVFSIYAKAMFKSVYWFSFAAKIGSFSDKFTQGITAVSPE